MEKTPSVFSWQQDWQNPPNILRPLQIVHGADLSKPEQVAYYRDQCGLGGLVINVGGKDYIRDADNWKRFVQGVRNVKDAGLRVWIYDENGYPSLSAGGVVLEKDPSVESLELVWDKTAAKPFTVRKSYEFTHASNSYSEARRYPNPLNRKAIDTFLAVTHDRYRRELGDELYRYVEAFFTDEPSLMAVNLGQIPEENRVNVPTRDPLDPTKKMLPAVPWSEEIEQKYKEEYGEELGPHFSSLFTGQSDIDRQVRFRFWSLISNLDRANFYRPIREFCQKAGPGPIASGHTLHEESLLHHVPMDGNKLEVLKEFDLPGMDVLSSNPLNNYYGGWKTALFPCSAAILIGQRLVMTEVSDFSEQNYGRKQQSNLAEMNAAAAWQASWGVTEFTLYYRIKGMANSPYRNEKTHREYSLFVGRMNAILRQAKPIRSVLLYYPIEVIQEEYLPTAEKLSLESQSPRLKEMINSFQNLGATLVHAHIPFIVIDRQTLTEMQNQEKIKGQSGRTKAQCHDFSGIIYPAGTQVEKLKWPYSDFKEIYAKTGNAILQGEELVQQINSVSGPRFKVNPPDEKLTFGSFERDNRLIFILSNPAETPYQGRAEFVYPTGMSFTGHCLFNGKKINELALENVKKADWSVFNPQTGTITTLKPNDNLLDIHLAPRETLIYVTSPVDIR